MDDHATAEFKVEKRSVNSKTLCEHIQKDIEELITSAGVMWGSDVHRDGFVETIGDYMQLLQEADKIDQWDSKCDLRNNTIAQMDKGIYIYEVNYRQKNCLNTTRLIYTIKDLLVASLKELLDFQIAP